jgi:hypothetical protein
MPLLDSRLFAKPDDPAPGSLSASLLRPRPAYIGSKVWGVARQQDQVRPIWTTGRTTDAFAFNTNEPCCGTANGSSIPATTPCRVFLAG